MPRCMMLMFSDISIATIFAYSIRYFLFFLSLGVDFLVKAIELQGKKIKLPLWYASFN